MVVNIINIFSLANYIFMTGIEDLSLWNLQVWHGEIEEFLS